MEAKRGQGVRIGDVAREAGVSRQAVYLYFHTRGELLIETTRFVDKLHKIDERLEEFQHAKAGLATLQAYIKFWGNYIPEIYGLAKALMTVSDSDKDAASAWEDRMAALRSGCECVIDCLKREGILATEWTRQTAIDMMWSMMSISVWENLIIDRGWSQNQYLSQMYFMLEQTLTK